MADEPEDTVLELGEDDLVEQAGDETQNGVVNDEAEDAELPTFDDGTEDQEDDTPRIREMRAKLRETTRELKQEREAKKPQPEIIVGEKPTLESCEWDEAKFEAELDAYKERQRKAEEQANSQTEAQRKSNEAWQATLTTYATKRAAFPQAAMEEAETAIASTLTPAQQAIIVSVADNPAKLIVALGRSQAKLDALAGVTDPLKFAATIAKLETEVKMPGRKPSVTPDRPQRGSAPAAQPKNDAEEARLEKEADRTNDYSKLFAYRRDKRKAA